MKSLAILFSCLFALAAAQKDGRDFEWQRKVTDYIGNGFLVPETTKVDFGRLTMLMKSSDPELRKTPFYRSDSFHDFKTGLLALKPLGSKQCFIGKVKTGFEETLNELQGRQAGEEPATGRRSLVVSRTRLRRTGSPLLDRFCAGLELRQVYDGVLIPTRPWIRFPPLYCIWGPVDIFFPIEKPIFGEGDLPPFIADWQGPYGPFP